MRTLLIPLILSLSLVTTCTQCSTGQGIVDDINSRVQFRYADLITQAHEASHEIAAQLRSSLHKPAFYVLHGHYFTVEEPKTTLKEVAERIPLEKRGPLYGLYLVQAQKWWNDQPTYLIEEWCAYLAGAEVRKELGIKDRYETVRFADEMAVYVSYLPMADWTFYKTQMKRMEKLR